MAFVRALDHLSPDELSTIGGKARVCATLRRAGLDVPDGFVVHCEPDSLPTASVAEALTRLGSGSFAVRSSAADEDGAQHSFAGVHATFLNVPTDDVVALAHRCLVSMHSEEARTYRVSRSLPPARGAQTVLVQRMVDARAAGVAFTVDPVRPGTEEMIITASWGSGEGVVEGLVEPDEIRVARATQSVTARYIGSKACRVESRGAIRHRVATSADDQARICLDAARIAALSTLLLRIEALLGGPQDVEWCHDDERFWIVQSRPVTGRAARADDAGIEWSRTNLREVLPDLTSPQSLELLTRLVDQAMRDYFGGLFAPEESLGPVIKCIGGRAYFNLSQFRHLARLSLIPPGVFLKGLGHADAIRPADMKLSLPPLRDFVRNLPTLGRLLADQALLGWRSRRTFAHAQRYLHDLGKTDMVDRSDEQLAALLDDAYENTREPLRSAYTSGSFLHWQRLLELLCARVGYPADVLLNAQLAVGEKTVSSRQAFEMLRIAHIGRADARVREYFSQQAANDPEFRAWGRALRGSLFKREVRAFLDDFGHRGPLESDWSLPRYREDPTPILFALGQLILAPDTPRPEDIDQRLNDEAKRVWGEFREAVPAPWREVALPFAAWVIRQMKWMYVFRERNRFEMVRMIEPIREVSKVLAKRFVQRGWLDREDDYFSLTVADVKQAIRGRGADMRAVAKRRNDEQARWARLDMPLLLAESDVEAVLAGATEPDIDAGGVRRLRGACTSPGKAEGEVVVLRDPRDFARMRPGAVIVAPAIDPSWTPLFTLAAGVVVEIGGVLSHASTIAREYGLPVLANCRDATRLLRDGERVRLDATAGIVERL